MRNAQGYATHFWDTGGIDECDTSTCGHCQRVTFVPTGKSIYDLGGGCRICGALICSKCVDRGGCTPWEEQMLKAERNYETDKMISRLVGR